jgi:hypothetical protein
MWNFDQFYAFTISETVFFAIPFFSNTRYLIKYFSVSARKNRAKEIVAGRQIVNPATFQHEQNFPHCSFPYVIKKGLK